MTTENAVGAARTGPLADGLAEYRRKVESGILPAPVLRTPWEKLREKPTDRRRIRAFCHNCMGWEEGAPRPAGIMTDIRDCTSPQCPFFDVRPYRK